MSATISGYTSGVVMNKPVILLAVLTFSIACSRVEKAEKNMTDMKKQTESMSSTTEEMAKVTAEMNETMEDQYLQLRSGDTVAIRNSQWKILMDEKEQFGAKIAAACVLYKSFEFQLWRGKGKDTEHARELLFADAVNEMTKHLDDLYKKIDLKKMSPTKDGKGTSYEQAFYALALGMHMNHNFQEELTAGKSSIQKISFYDLVKKSLRKEELKGNTTEHETNLVSGPNREIMVELVKARVDILSALALKNLTDKRKMTMGQKISGAWFKITGGALGSIKLPVVFAKSNDATKDQTISYLDAAQKARTFLVEIGEDKQLEETLKSAFEEIDLDEDQDPSQSQSETKGEALKREEIKGLIASLLA
jgi:hypothetical protein